MTRDLREGLKRWEERCSQEGASRTEWAAFVAFCAQLGLPTTVDAVSLYLIHLYDTRPRSAAALRYRLRLLDLACALDGRPQPSHDSSLRLFLRGLHRTLSTGTEATLPPLYLEDLEALLQAIDRDQRHQLRDTALVLLADATAVPDYVLRLLQWHQVRFRHDTVTLDLPRRTGNQPVRIKLVIPKRPGPACPVAALRAWSRHVGPSDGYVFSTRAGQPPHHVTVTELVAPLEQRVRTWDASPRPSPAEVLRPYLEQLSQPRPRELRDRAFLTLGFAACLTTHEARNLRLRDVEAVPEGLLIHPPDRTTSVSVPRGRLSARCPVSAWSAWRQELLQTGAPQDQFAFTQIRERAVSTRRLEWDSLTRIVKTRCEQARLQDEYGFSSLRVGFIRTAARSGTPEHVIAHQAGLASLNSVMVHVRRERLLSHNAASLVGL